MFSCRKKPVFTVIGVLSLLLLIRIVWVFSGVIGFDPPIIVSKETTFITEPLAEDGLPDYYTFVCDRARKGVQPANNAAVLLWQAVGPRYIPHQLRKEFFQELGIDPLPLKGNYYVPFDEDALVAKIARRLEEEGTESRFSEDIATRALSSIRAVPWNSQQFPEVSEWLESNFDALDLVISASLRSHYFSPLLGDSPEEGAHPSLLSVYLLTEMLVEKLSGALSRRAMWHLGEGRIPESQENIDAIRRLARLVGKKGAQVSVMLALGCDEMGNKAQLALLSQETLGEQELRVLLAQLSDKPRWEAVRQALVFDRVMTLDSVLGCKRYGFDTSTLSADASNGMDWTFLISIDWNVVLRDFNVMFDREDGVASLPLRVERKEKYSQLENQLRAIEARVQIAESKSKAGMDMETRSQIISDIFVSLMMPATNQALNAQDQANTRLQLVRLATALALFNKANGSYPEQLTELVPKILPNMPLDMYSDKPFIYERKPDGGFLLYSVFKNEVDDGGTSFYGEIVEGEWVEEENNTVDYGKSDLVIRMPAPEFTMPEPPRDDDDDW